MPVTSETLGDVIPDLRSYHLIVVSSSAGKDSECALDETLRIARLAGVEDRVHVVHCDLGRAEWKGTAELAVKQALWLGVPRERIHVIKYRNHAGREMDLLEHIEAHGKFPGTSTRYCTSDHKRGPTFRVFTKLASEVRAATGASVVRILDVMGIRAEESPIRAKGADKLGSAFGFRKEASNGIRHVDTWYPVFRWSTERIWSHIHSRGIPYHPAYDAGMPRLSCVFCFYSAMGKDLAPILIAGEHNPELLEEYVQLERRIGHRLTKNVSAAEIQARLAAGERGNPELARQMVTCGG